MNRRANASVAGIALLVGGALAGCSSTGAMTCEEYAALGLDQQTMAIMNMATDHNLDPTSNIWGTAKMGAEVSLFCGVDGLLGNATSTRNETSPIDEAIDWDSYRGD